MRRSPRSRDKSGQGAGRVPPVHSLVWLEGGSGGRGWIDGTGLVLCQCQHGPTCRELL